MLPDWQILEVRRLLEIGELSQRQIAARAGVSRGTVAAVANGLRGLCGEESCLPMVPIDPSLPPARCPQCGGLVHMPCVLCASRAFERQSRLAPSAPPKRRRRPRTMRRPA